MTTSHRSLTFRQKENIDIITEAATEADSKILITLINNKTEIIII